MKDQFVPYELAVKLKELGLDEECFGYSYRDTPDQKSSLNIYFAKQPINNSSLKEDKGIALPLWQQAFDWFRKKHNYVGTIYANASGYCFEIHDSAPKGGSHRYDSDFTGPNDSGCWNKYEEARKACLEKLIEILEETK